MRSRAVSEYDLADPDIVEYGANPISKGRSSSFKCHTSDLTAVAIPLVVVCNRTSRTFAKVASSNEDT